MPIAFTLWGSMFKIQAAMLIEMYLADGIKLND